MSMNMRRLFLTSSIHAVAHHIASQLDISRNKLVFIDTAVEPDGRNKEWLKRDRNSLVVEGFDVTDYTLTDKTSDQLMAELMPFDHIYISGGNATYLLQKSQESGFKKVMTMLLDEGKTYISTSAGSIIAGPFLPPYLIKENTQIKLMSNEALNLVPFTILPHWGSVDFEKKYLGSRIETAYYEYDIPLVLLSDKQYVSIVGDCMKIVSVIA